MKIWGNTLVKNEDRYLWFSVLSVISYVDKILIWDTGSTDKTVKIIKEIKKKYPEKVDYREIGNVDIFKFTQVRQEMLEKSDSDWVIIVDGDEVWWEDSIKSVVNFINSDGEEFESIVNKYYNIVGDIYHFQEEKAGQYEIDNLKGHLNIRAMSKNIPGLHFAKPHGQQGIYDQDNLLIQERNSMKRKHLNRYYMHFTNMPRSSGRSCEEKVPKRIIKYKYEIGHQFPLDFYYPEVFFMNRPCIVPNPWENYTCSYFVKACVQTPFKQIKRNLKFFGKVGY